ncbi:EamA family transporter [Phenylobacterium hankyongense]|uniref:EamA family transporter n=1 Tax=Phenylobacterium hankyongense TaxID=1813876 RepID=A0A328B6C6_9CAUL|nr:EamA family transporter [Phenylobacterium hankyongense]RAK61486.1 EamA family transporter [Phenylobacterium hankyongense]
MNRTTLTPLHALLALAVVAVWGTNFVVIKVGLGRLPPLTFAALRFTFALVPAVFFVRRPAVPWRNLAAYGVLIGVGQFGVLYIAMRSMISPGLASLVVQMQVFFTIALAMKLTGERIRGFQVAALALAAAGLGWLMAHANAEVTPLGLALVLFAALSWAGGNIVARASGGVNMLAYVVWASLFSAPPLFVLALLAEGWPAISQGIAHADALTWAAVLWQSVGNTLFGYAAWGWLLARYPAATISPLSLLVPVFGMAASAVLLGEPLSSWKLTAAALVLGGLAINTLWPMMERRRAASVA